MAAQQFIPFALPEHTGSKNGWGPAQDAVPDMQMDIPFQPFHRGDRVNKISDWNPAFWLQSKRRYDNKSANAQQSAAFAYTAEEETGFQSMDTSSGFKPKDGRRKFKKFSFSNRRPVRPANRWPGRAPVKVTGRVSEKKKLHQNRRRNYNNQEERAPSVPIDPSWSEVAVIGFEELRGLAVRVDSETLVEAGSLDVFDRKMDRALPKQSVRLQQSERNPRRVVQRLNPGTVDDPVLKELRAKKSGTIYATDTVLGVLMAAPKSVLSWDIVVRVQQGEIVLDKRQGSEIDRLTVNESWNEVFEQDEANVNHPEQLRDEATLLNYNFIRHCARPADESAAEAADRRESPFAQDDIARHGLYRYRRWDFGGDIQLVARTKVDAVVESKHSSQTLCLRALNEFDQSMDSAINWRASLETQPEAVLAAELKKNSNKLCRWLAETCLSGANQIRLGFVSRANMHGNVSHDILMLQRFSRPEEFAQSLNISVPSLWGTLYSFLQLIQQSCREDGTYIVVKDPNSPKIQIYNCNDRLPGLDE